MFFFLLPQLWRWLRRRLRHARHAMKANRPVHFGHDRHTSLVTVGIFLFSRPDSGFRQRPHNRNDLLRPSGNFETSPIRLASFGGLTTSRSAHCGRVCNIYFSSASSSAGTILFYQKPLTRNISRRSYRRRDAACSHTPCTIARPRAVCTINDSSLPCTVESEVLS